MRATKSALAAVLICTVLTMVTGCGGGNGRGNNNTGAQITAPNSLTTASIGVPYSVQFTASGSNVVWSISAGSLPPGLTLDATSGQYSGTPTALGSYSFTVAATNDFGMDTRAFMQNVMVPVSDSNALLSGNRLTAFPSTFASGFEAPVAITGLNSGDQLVSIDRRPQNGFLYGLGYNPTAGSVQLYAISSTTAVAVPLGTPGGFVASDGTTPVRIFAGAATTFGIDFNPTVDRVRVITGIGQNFRMNPNNGALIDGDPNSPGVNMDGMVNGATTTLQETAYTNSVQNTTVTTQYGVDAVIDAVCIQNPPNAGTQTNCLPLSIPVETVQGFDIAPAVSVTTSNAPATGMGVAVVRASGRTQDELVSINLATGAVITAGPLTMAGVIGIALQQPSAMPIVTLSADGTQLSRFLSISPGNAVTVSISGVANGETLVGIDYRPQTGQLFSFGVNPTADNGTVYILDPQTGAATVVGTPGMVSFVDVNGVTVDLPPASVGYGFDFNPTVDRIRLVNNAGLNSRLNPITGGPVDGNASAPGINPDGSINMLPAGSTGVAAAAYTNSFGQTLPGSATTQYALDPVSNMLFIQNPPNNGTLTMGQPVSLNGTTLDFSEANGFDIPANVAVSTSGMPAMGLGFAALTTGSTTRLYSIDLSTGNAQNLGTLSGGVSGLAVGQMALR